LVLRSGERRGERERERQREREREPPLPLIDQLNLMLSSVPLISITYLRKAVRQEHCHELLLGLDVVASSSASSSAVLLRRHRKKFVVDSCFPFPLFLRAPVFCSRDEAQKECRRS